MIAIDTNVVVRVIVNDDAAQARRAVALITSGPVHIPATVLLETESVLRYTYELETDVIVAALKALLGTSNVHVDSPHLVARALDWCASGLDFADALHVALSDVASELATFDRDFVKRAAAGLTIPRVVPVPP